MHGSVTFNDFHKDNLYWIGFDCAHSTDILPSMEMLKKRYNFHASPLDELREKYKDSPIFNPTYKNISYAIGECKSLAEQLAGIKK